ncbi:hypothetical protein SODALDRAFT_204735 [Sodiomyces alkalinus F11]|uniref:Uncharacterized protein n=1 Tax=Sodiomyces alkalinus (strain CBS 110278 / VKM F-3762 / F11) TaxID=1314773 RepID=A0A3N2PQA0_SODAK|nr:hypothetical protein SODALDRAFT_204735 [Sodiomyces alkalinus F11]ROT36675.1 hypothetical protein SODALDRAFT_204735 [Sodiomyces alkalinus F11]
MGFARELMHRAWNLPPTSSDLILPFSLLLHAVSDFRHDSRLSTAGPGNRSPLNHVRRAGSPIGLSLNRKLGGSKQKTQEEERLLRVSQKTKTTKKKSQEPPTFVPNCSQFHLLFSVFGNTRIRVPAVFTLFSRNHDRKAQQPSTRLLISVSFQRPSVFNPAHHSPLTTPLRPGSTREQQGAAARGGKKTKTNHNE